METKFAIRTGQGVDAMTNSKITLSIFVNFFLFAILLNSVGTVILQAQLYFGVLASSAAVLEVLKDAGLGVVSFFIASFITRIGYKNSMLVAIVIMTVACFAVPLMKTFLAIKILFALAGCSFALLKISIFGTVGLIARNEKEHICIMNFIESFFMVGILCGYLIFSRYINDADQASDSWFDVYYILGVFSAAAFFILLFSPLDESMVRQESTSALKNEFRSMLKIATVPLIMSFMSSIFLYTLIEQSIMCWLPTFNNKQLQLSSDVSVMMTGLLALSIAAGRFVTGFVIRKISWFKAPIICLIAIVLLVAATLPFTGQTDDGSIIPAVAYVFPMIGFFMAPIYPVINSVMLSSLPKEKHALMAGLIVIFSSIGGITGSVVTGYIFQSYGGKSAFYFSLLPVIVLSLMIFMLRRNKGSRWQYAFSEKWGV